MEHSEKLRHFWQAMLGGTLVTSGFWGPVLDHMVAGAHIVTALTGAVIGLHGVYRLFKPKRRRDTMASS